MVIMNISGLWDLNEKKVEELLYNISQCGLCSVSSRSEGYGLARSDMGKTREN
jgi:hypothetical protein